jgi:hypothetical protein
VARGSVEESAVPKSRVRKKQAYTPPPPPHELVAPKERRWIAPLMVTLFLVGLIYLVVWYLAGNDVPVMKDLSALVNVGIGFGLILGGFICATQWR